ncbi:MAG TPA: ABC transporter permease, partial [Flavobacteriales bacterium]|nr:ABC transporter permease [Flavobacteriales bacterium]
MIHNENEGGAVWWDQKWSASDGILKEISLKKLISPGIFRVLLFRDLKVSYRQTLLGPLWFVLKPVLTALTFYFLFALLGRADGLNSFLFFLSGIVMWMFFSETLNRLSDSILTNINLLSKVYFPRITIHTAIVAFGLFTAVIQTLLLLCLLGFLSVFHDFQFSFSVFLFPIPLLMTSLLLIGMGLLFSSLTVHVRDLRYVIGFLLQLLMFLSSVFFPVNSQQGILKIVIALNPMSGSIELFRYALLGTEFSWMAVTASFVYIFFFLIVGFLVFRSVEENIADV